MDKVRALRGVCIGVDRHLLPGDIADVDGAQFLVSIGAVEFVPDVPEPPEVPETEPSAKADKKEK